MILGLKISTFIIWIACSFLIGFIVGLLTGLSSKKK